MTLYRHFPSKQDLVRAYLQRRDEASWRWFVERVAELGDTAETRLLAMFDALREWFETPQLRGRAFLNASAEYSEGDAEIRSLVAAHKHRIEEFIRAEAAEAGAADPAAAASGVAAGAGCSIGARRPLSRISLPGRLRLQHRAGARRSLVWPMGVPPRASRVASALSIAKSPRASSTAVAVVKSPVIWLR